MLLNKGKRIVRFIIYLGMFVSQFKAIQAKNWIINIRNKEYLRENASVLILSIFIVISERTNPNSFTTPLYLAIAVTSYSRALASWWLQEKESHQKELQKIMGVNYLSYLFSWLAYFIINGLMIALLMLIIMKLLVITDDTDFAEGYSFMSLVPLYLLFVLTTIGYVLTLCSFFSTSKTGTQAVTFIQLITNFLYFLGFSSDISSSPIAVMILSIFPQMSFSMSISSISFLNPANFSANFDFSYQRGIITMLIAAPAYMLLALYLQEVIPSELGTHKHPLFFLGFKHKHDRPGELTEPLMGGQELRQGQDSSAKFQERIDRKQPPLIRLKNVSKCFGDLQAVDNLSINFYGGQIFCLLGHNGAGKSTTINLLTGLLEVSKGQIDILGLSYPGDVDQIRKDIGLCLQYNVLYDSLTVEDHLAFYYKIKNQDTSNLQPAVNRIIEECALHNERGKLAANLSGGNKRKLCLANSLIGGSRIIFLDEPSSGLDPNSRQSIWAILKNISSQNRCIILTTHHLEEAEELSKRIGILSRGNLIIVGSPQFITKQFSVGYHAVITLNKQHPNAATKCREIISDNLKRCTEDKQTAKNTLKFIMPLEELPNFAKTFRALEEAKIGLISVYVSNLEDAFVKIGEDQDNFNEGFHQLNSSSEEILTQKEGEERPAEKQELVLPPVQCSYSFFCQFKAVFLKKMRTVLRSFSTVVSLIMPILFMSVGVLVVCIAIKNNETDPAKRVDLDRVRLFVMSYFMVWAFIFNTSSYSGHIVLERQKKFKYLSNVSGIRQLPYWTANYAFDLLIFLLPIGFFFIIVALIGQNGQFITRFAGYLISMLVLFGFSFIGYSYVFSFIFQKSSTAFRFFPFINLVFFYFLPLIPTVVAPDGVAAQYIMPFLTPFVAFSSFFNTEQIVGSAFGQTIAYNKLAISYSALAVQAIAYAAATLLLENIRFSLKVSKDEQFQQALNQHHIRANQGGIEANARESFEGSPIKVKHLTKIYGNGKIALRNNSFSVPEGQIFGLLGPNGAGKSTSFNIITAAIPKTSGNVQLFHQEVNKGIMTIFEQVGVCPQYNPLYDNLTLKEHLEYFALAKGIPNEQIPRTLAFYQELLSLKEYMNVRAGVLSGGNKRKMCVAMAMIGNPNVAFFDEPSAGVDPISRRYLWKGLSASTNSRKTAMVLTTHSMNQAQSLCSRIGILINGQFVCLDTPKALKQQYGKGYRINVLANPQNHSQLQQIVKGEFGQQTTVQKLQTDQNRVVFVIGSDKFCLSRAFDLFEGRLKGEGKIQNYEIRESTLQQVFIFLSRLQQEVVEQNIQEPWEFLCWEWGATGCHFAL